MAAQEYYNGGSTVETSYARPSVTFAPSPSSSIPPPQGPPPPYQPYSPQLGASEPHHQFQPDSKVSYPQQGYPHSQPAPPMRQQYYNQPQYQPRLAYLQQQAYQPQQYPAPAGTGSLRPNFFYQSGQQPYSGSPQLRPQSASPYPSYRRDSTPLAYSPRRSRSRSRDRDYDNGHNSSRHSKHRHRRASTPSKARGRLDTFVGAGGGAIIGDAIFPGLGTVGGALLGGYGGHKVAKEKRRSASHGHAYRDRYEREWEDGERERERERENRRRY